MPKQIPEEQKRVVLNCLVMPETIDWLKSHGVQGRAVDYAVAAARMAEAQGRVMPVKKQSKKAAHVEALKSNDVTAQVVGRDDIEYGERTELPQGENVAMINHSRVPLIGRIGIDEWRANRKPLLKPGDKR